MKTRSMSESRQQRYTERKLCMANLIALFDEITDFMDKKTSVNTIYLNFNIAFNTVSLSTPGTKCRYWDLSV